METTTSSSAIMSPISISPNSWEISVLLSSPYFALIAVKSSITISSIFLASCKIALNSAIFSSKFLRSALSVSTSKEVNLTSLVSKTACACFSERIKLVIRPFKASCLSLDFLITSITSSMLARAITRPSTMCFFSSVLTRSYSIPRLTTSC